MHSGRTSRGPTYGTWFLLVLSLLIWLFCVAFFAEYDPDRHCGVLLEGDKKRCRKSLACKVCVCVFMCVSLPARYVCVCICVCFCVCVFMFVCVCLCMCVYIVVEINVLLTLSGVRLS